jgi:RNA polymerase sigma factor (sigma-70 family)
MQPLEVIRTAEIRFTERLQAGEEAAFAELYDRYGRTLYAVIVEVVQSEADAENILQDAFVKIWRNISMYDPAKGRLYTWLLTLVRRLALDFVRSQYFRERKMNQSVDNAVYISGPSPEMSRLENIGVLDVVSKLAPELKQVIDLQYFKGYTQQEVSDETGLPLGTVKSRTRAAILLLRKQLQEV